MKFKNIYCIVLAAALFVTNFGVAAENNDNESVKVSALAVDSAAENISYSDYYELYSAAPEVKEEIKINATEYASATTKVNRKTYENEKGLYISAKGNVSWEFAVKETGFYRIGCRYYTVEGNASDIEREIYIDSKLPFAESASLSLTRVWKSSPIKADSSGNDMYTTQTEINGWYEAYFRDSVGYYDDELCFYLEKGVHTITMKSVKEPIVISKIFLSPENKFLSYDEAIKEYNKSGYYPVKLQKPIKIQAETANRKSAAELAPYYDRSSANIEPYKGSKLSMNVISSDRFNNANEWVEYDVEVPQDGLYVLTFKAKQNASRGLKTAMRLYVNGEIPYKEAQRLEFEYSSDYVNLTFGGDKPYYIYLKKGNNTIRLESSLGMLGEYCREVTQAQETLNTSYRRLIVLAGTNPDTYRDYSVDTKLPEVIETFRSEAKRLRNIASRLTEAMDGKSSYTAILETVALQLEKMYKHPSRIAREVQNFNSNLSSLGTWISDIKQYGANFDLFYITDEAAVLPKAGTNFFSKIAFEVISLISSFAEDYNTIGENSMGSRRITVWMNSGRDQATVLKQLINSSFTPNSDIKVELKLVQGALLQAVVAGQGPDVALSVGQGDPINYATRNAVYDISEFDDFTEVTKRFADATMVPLSLEGACYGLPETATFPVLYYRNDIFKELNLKVPNNWDEVYELLPILQSKNMTMGLPVSDVTEGNAAGVQTYGSLLYQNGGSFYNSNGSSACFDSEEAITAMRRWTDLYISYGLPLSYNFVNRFASGEMPIALADYTYYNQLTVFAPQLKGKWSIALVPGTVKVDGSVDHSAPISVTACMILNDAKDKDACWEFIKWWTSEDAQTNFGREVEVIVGEAGRYATANLQAMQKMAWSTENMDTLLNQFSLVVGIPEIPGGYYAWRNLDNAFREIINEGTETREVMTEYNKIINEEIAVKRQELLK